MPGTILIIDDDERLTAMLAEYLGTMDLQLTARATVVSGLEALDRGSYDALILDVMLPDGDGFDVCRQVRASSDIPILMLTARGDEMDRIIGPELGADDYLPKPFNPRELLARLRAMMRRRPDSPTSMTPSKVQRFGTLLIDRDQRIVRVDDEEKC